MPTLIENQKKLLPYNKGQVNKANQQCKWLKITLTSALDKQDGGQVSEIPQGIYQ